MVKFKKLETVYVLPDGEPVEVYEDLELGILTDYGEATAWRFKGNLPLLSDSQLQAIASENGCEFKDGCLVMRKGQLPLNTAANKLGRAIAAISCH